MPDPITNEQLTEYESIRAEYGEDGFLETIIYNLSLEVRRLREIIYGDRDPKRRVMVDAQWKDRAEQAEAALRHETGVRKLLEGQIADWRAEVDRLRAIVTKYDERRIAAEAELDQTLKQLQASEEEVEKLRKQEAFVNEREYAHAQTVLALEKAETELGQALDLVEMWRGRAMQAEAEVQRLMLGLGGYRA